MSGRPRRLVVVGDTVLDRDVRGRVERMCPDAPDAPVLDVEEVVDRPGGAGLAALLCAEGDVEVTLVTALGGDAAGDRVAAGLRGRVRLRPVLRTAATVGKTRVRRADGSLVRLDDAGHLLGGRAQAGGSGHLSAVDETSLRAVLRSADAVLVADYGGELTRHRAVRAAVAAAAPVTPVVWDPHPRGLAPVEGVAVSTPNRAEAERGTGLAGAPAAELAAALLDRWPVRAVTVTDGAAGATTVRRDGTVHHAPAPPVTGPGGAGPLDTCGAGDRFAGGLALALASGHDLPGAVGDAAATTSRWLDAGGVATVASAPAAAEAAGAGAARAGRVVATGGCFDVLHVGHLALLQAAADMGDRLVVLVNSDASVARLKGPGRPVQPQEDRVRLLAGLRCVDEVVVFDEDTPVRALERLRPDVWVKGGDYDPELLPETPTVRAAGGQVTVVPVVSGRSTSAILARGSAREPSRTTSHPTGAAS